MTGRPRVLLWMPRASEIPGGHRVQFEQTASALRDLGVDATLTFDSDPTWAEIDVVHGFGLTAGEVHSVRRKRIPVVVSTIYNDRSFRVTIGERALTTRARLGRVRRAARMARLGLGSRDGFLQATVLESQSEIRLMTAYEAADLLLPNAKGEAEAIVRDLGVSTPMRVVPNAVDPTVFKRPMSEGSTRSRVICVARIEPHKNQLGLIEALRGSGYDLVIVGPAHPHHPDYHRQCRRAGDGWVTFTGNVSHDDLATHLAQARVHVLPTWFETTGLASLEAALCGCAVVTTSRGYAAEYFGDLAEYCDPAEPSSIRTAVDRAWQRGAVPALEERILQRYTWRHTAEATLSGYRSLLDPVRD